MTILDFIERQRARPEQVRRRMSYVAAGGASGIIAVAWLVALFTNGFFPAATPSIAGEQAPDALQQAAAVHAALPSDTSSAQDSSLSVIETKTSSTLDEKPSGTATVLPF